MSDILLLSNFSLITFNDASFITDLLTRKSLSARFLRTMVSLIVFVINSIKSAYELYFFENF